MKTIPDTFSIITLGCAKNTVDARSMSALLTRSGLREISNDGLAEFIIVNTCGFIDPARQESMETLRSLASKKKNNQKLIAAGCLSEREKSRIYREIPQLNAALGTRRWMDIVRVIERTKADQNQPYMHFPLAEKIGADPIGVMRAAIQGGSAYLKIADGCDRTCAFCAIHLIKGRMVSRSLEAILSDANKLAQAGVREINLIAQDTTSWGKDLQISDGLPKLLKKLLEIEPVIPWIRVLYAFPGEISQDLISLFKNEPRILPYLDIPLQHAHPAILRAMRRPADIESVKNLLDDLKAQIPHIAIRTTFIVGFPGEGFAEFETLLKFVDSMRFDRVGIFPYYPEQGTSSINLDDTTAQSEKERRVSELAALQESISLDLNRSLIGEEIDVLVEGFSSGMSVARSYRDAPEIDGLVFIRSKLEVGELFRVRVTDALVHDLNAELV